MCNVAYTTISIIIYVRLKSMWTLSFSTMARTHSTNAGKDTHTQSHRNIEFIHTHTWNFEQAIKFYLKCRTARHPAIMLPLLHACMCICCTRHCALAIFCLVQPLVARWLQLNFALHHLHQLALGSSKISICCIYFLFAAKLDECVSRLPVCSAGLYDISVSNFFLQLISSACVFCGKVILHTFTHHNTYIHLYMSELPNGTRMSPQRSEHTEFYWVKF